MAHNAFSSRPWKRTLVPAGALVVIFIFLVAQYHDNILYSLQSVQSDKNLDAASSVGRPSVEHTARRKTKAIVTAVQTKDETTADWLAEFLPDWDTVVYVTDRSSDEAAPSRASRIPLQHLPVNKGREAAVYLTYIVQHYHNLPDYMVFIHGKRYQIHNDDPMLDTLPLIQKLNLDHVKKEGYASLRCNWMHCPKAQVSPVLGHDDDLWSIDGLYASAWTDFFPNETVPNAVSGPCCAQFAVTREAVQRLPIDKYEQIRQWIWALEVKEGEASMKAGLVLEYMWHILFGKPVHYCPSAKECYCDKFSLCDLECEGEGWCLGRIWQNPHRNAILSLPVPLPDGWPEKGQSKPGEGGYFPYQGWEKIPEEVLHH